MLRITNMKITSTRLAALLLCCCTCLWAAETPDFTGVWMAYDSEPSVFAAPENLTDEGKSMVESFYAKYESMPEPGGLCVPPGMPYTMLAMVSYPIEILHSRDRITILAEYEMQSRRIFMDGRDHPDPDEYPYSRMGHSIAHWEGETLVIETRLLKESLYRQWWLRTNNTVVTERVHMAKRSELDAEATGYLATVQPPIGDDALVFDITVEDETLYTEPRKITMYYQRISDDSFLEYDCTEEYWYRALKEAVKK